MSVDDDDKPETKAEFLAADAWYATPFDGEAREPLRTGFTVLVERHGTYLVPIIQEPGSYVPIFCNRDPVLVLMDDAKEYLWDQYAQHLDAYLKRPDASNPAKVEMDPQ